MKVGRDIVKKKIIFFALIFLLLFLSYIFPRNFFLSVDMIDKIQEVNMVYFLEYEGEIIDSYKIKKTENIQQLVEILNSYKYSRFHISDNKKTSSSTIRLDIVIKSDEKYKLEMIQVFDKNIVVINNKNFSVLYNNNLNLLERIAELNWIPEKTD